MRLRMKRDIPDPLVRPVRRLRSLRMRASRFITEGRGENETSAMRGPTRAHSLKRLISALDSLCGADSPQSAPHSFYPRPAAPIRH